MIQWNDLTLAFKNQEVISGEVLLIVRFVLGKRLFVLGMKAGVEFATQSGVQGSGASASPGNWLAMQRSGPAPHQLNQDPHTDKTPRQFPHTLKV